MTDSEYSQLPPHPISTAPRPPIKTAIPQAHPPPSHPTIGSSTTTTSSTSLSVLPPYRRGPAPKPPKSPTPPSNLNDDNDVYSIHPQTQTQTNNNNNNNNNNNDENNDITEPPQSSSLQHQRAYSSSSAMETSGASLGVKGSTSRNAVSPPPPSTTSTTLSSSASLPLSLSSSISNSNSNSTTNLGVSSKDTKEGKDQKRKKITIKRFFRTKTDEPDEIDFLNISGPTNFRKNDLHQEGNTIVSEDGKTVSTIPDRLSTSSMTSGNSNVTSSIASPTLSSSSLSAPGGLGSEGSSGGGGGGFMGIGKKKIDPTKRPRCLNSAEFRSNILKLVQKMKEMDEYDWAHPLLVDYWSSRPLTPGEWCDPPVAERALVPVAMLAEKGYHVETSDKCISGKVSFGGSENGEDFPVIFGDRDYKYFEEFFGGKGSETYVVDDSENPCIVSISKCTELFKVLIRTKKEDKRVLVPADNYFKALKIIAPELKDLKLIKIKNNDFAEKELLEAEKMELRTNFKFGIICCKPDETTEDDDGGADYEDFLNFIGEKITLKGYEGYKGGLDTYDDNSGKYSIKASFRNYEIMFHVSTLLPYSEHDTQNVERKRHIGNDVVTIVFKSQSSPDDLFNPCVLNSHFIHSVVVVTPERRDAQGVPTHYRVTVANKPGVPPYPPYLPEEGVMEKGPGLRNFLYAKMINAERAAYTSPDFSTMVNSRKERLSYLTEIFLEENGKSKK